MQDSVTSYQLAPSALDKILALAPHCLINNRRLRYLGDDQCIPLGTLAARDQVLLRDLYRKLNALLDALADTSTGDEGKWQAVTDWMQRQDLDKIIDEVRELGLASHEQDHGETLAKTLHDVRGGALTPLLGRLQLIDHLPHRPNQLNTLFLQARDHLKIMRNAITGLDEPRRDADRRPKAHAMRLLLDKWHEATVGPNWRERPIRMVIDSRFDGPVTECCLESAAIDRIFYNLATNAARHASSDRLEMAVVPLPAPPPAMECLRFVLSNRLTSQDAARLLGPASAAGADAVHLGTGRSLMHLFEPEDSVTGSGFGLTIVADFVARAFGLEDRHEALRERYVGAIVEDRDFRVWFHWPAASGDPMPAKLDDCHHPRESLTEP